MLSLVRFVDCLQEKLLEKNIGITTEDLRNAIEAISHKFEITECEAEIDPTKDIERKINMFLTTKQIEGTMSHTINAYRAVLKQFAAAHPYKVSDLTTQHFRQYIANRSEVNKQTTVIHHVSVIRTFFNWLVVEGFLSKNPMDRIPPMKPPKRLPKGLSVEEIETLREICDDARSRAMVEMFYSTGARVEELQSAKISDIDFERRTMKIIGKGDIERKVYLTHRSVHHFKKYIESRDGKSDRLFLSIRAPFRPIGVRAIQDEFTRLGKLAKLNKPLHPHRLRHSCATTLLNNGAALSMVQKVLGHANCSITERYCQLIDKNVQDQFDRFMI